MKTYKKPELTHIGKLENLTTGDSGKKRESTQSKNSKRQESSESGKRP